MTNILHYFLNKPFFVSFLLLCSLSTFAQQTIHGTVVDKANQPIPGVTVFIESSTKGTITDLDGNFSLSTEQELPIILNINLLGFKTEEIHVYERMFLFTSSN